MTREEAKSCICTIGILRELCYRVYGLMDVVDAQNCKKLIEMLNGVCDWEPSAQPECIQNNAVHLCDSCQYTHATCPSHGNDAVFGDGKGNDNICACNKYRPISAQPERPEQPESAREYCAECDHIEMCRWYPYEGCDFRSMPSAHQEPRSPLYYGDGYSEGKMVYDSAECPNCGYIYDEGDQVWGEPYCPHCGQALDWYMRGEQDE